MNSLIFYNILLFTLLCLFIPSLYTYMYSNSIGRLVIILLIAYFSKVNFYLGLVFITIVIILSSKLYEGFEVGQSGIITTNYRVEENEKKSIYLEFSVKKAGWFDYCIKQDDKNMIEGISGTDPFAPE